MPRLMIMTSSSTVSEESLARDRPTDIQTDRHKHTQSDTYTHTHGVVYSY